jgi:hypothetical protein
MPFIASLLLAAAGAAVLLAVVEGTGGDFGDWPLWRAIAVPCVAFLVPAVVCGFVARGRGMAEAILWAVVCAGMQLALVVGVGFLWLGLGPEY